jgi:1-deoxy-D-xylulose-5-phosphate synthase
LEENAVAGGAGSGVAEFLANAGVICQLRHIGIPDAFIAHAGQGECRQLAGLTADNIIAVAQSTAPVTTNQQAL